MLFKLGDEVVPTKECLQAYSIFYTEGKVYVVEVIGGRLAVRVNKDRRGALSVKDNMFKIYKHNMSMPLNIGFPIMLPEYTP